MGVKTKTKIDSDFHKAHIHEQFCLKGYKKKSFLYFLLGIFSLAWFLIRTGTKPTRALYPCQQVALANSIAFVPGLTTTVVVGAKPIRKFLKKYWFLPWFLVLILINIIYATI